MIKLLMFALLFTVSFSQVMPVAPAYAGLGRSIVKKAFSKSFKAPKIKVYKAPKIYKAPRPMAVPKAPIKINPVPYKFKSSINTSKVKVGNTIFTGKQGASLNRIKTSVPFKQSKTFTPTYKQPPVMPKQVVKRIFNKDSIKFPAKPLPKAQLHTRGINPKVGTRVRPDGVPKNWRIRNTKKSGGTKYTNPSFKNREVRVMQGDSKSKWINSQKPYARQQVGTKSFLKQNGAVGINKSSSTHIPLEKFKFRGNLS